MQKLLLLAASVTLAVLMSSCYYDSPYHHSDRGHGHSHDGGYKKHHGGGYGHGYKKHRGGGHGHGHGHGDGDRRRSHWN